MGEALPRGTVTFLFSDIEGSSELVRRVGVDVFAVIRADHRRTLRAAFAEHGGREIDTAGDGFFVVFDSACSAVSAAVDAQRSLAGFTWPDDAVVSVRIGLHTAEPGLADEGYVGIGVHRASRICDAARGGQILVSNATAGIIEDAELEGVELVDLGLHRLKSLPREQRLFQVTVDGLRSEFDRPRAADTRAAGTGTFLVTDLMGFRNIIQSLGDEGSEAVAADYRAAVCAAVEANDGIVLEQTADNVLAVFPDAPDAIRAAAAVRERLAEFAWPPGCDVAVAAAVHSGRWSGDRRRVAAGTALRRLLLISQMVERGQVLVSQTTASLVEGDRSAPVLRDLGERELPGLDGSVHLYELGDSPPA